MANAPRDENHLPTTLWVSSVDWVTPVPLSVNPVTWRVLVNITWWSSPIFTNNGSIDIRLPVWANWTVLSADSTQAEWIKWSSAWAWDMVLASIQSVTWLKTFDKDKAAMKGTSTGVNTISVANTSATSYTNTIPAKTGTFAMTSDITGTNSGTNTW